MSVNGVVLIVDDDPDTACELSEMLSSGGYECDSYVNPIHAMRRTLADSSVELLLVDMNMPFMDGILMVDKIQQYLDTNRNIAVIFFSGDPNKGSLIKALQLGAVDFLKKPFSYDELICSISKAGIALRSIKPSYTYIELNPL